MKIKLTNFERRARKVRGRMRTADRPRLTVHRTNKAIYAQIIAVGGQTTVVSAASAKLAKKGMTKTQQAEAVGQEIAEKAVAKKITQVVFDRAGYRYHGRVKALAEAARKGGLAF